MKYTVNTRTVLCLTFNFTPVTITWTFYQTTVQTLKTVYTTSQVTDTAFWLCRAALAAMICKTKLIAEAQFIRRALHHLPLWTLGSYRQGFDSQADKCRVSGQIILNVFECLYWSFYILHGASHFFLLMESITSHCSFASCHQLKYTQSTFINNISWPFTGS